VIYFNQSEHGPKMADGGLGGVAYLHITTSAVGVPKQKAHKQKLPIQYSPYELSCGGSGYMISLYKPRTSSECNQLCIDLVGAPLQKMDVVEERTCCSACRTCVCEDKVPKIAEYFCQMLVIFSVILVSPYKLCTSTEGNQLWIALLCSCLGYMLPTPNLKNYVKNVPILPNST